MDSIIDNKIQEIYTPQSKEQLKGALNNPRESMRILTKGSLFMFMTYMWDTYTQDKFVPNWHIKYLADELETIARRVAAGDKREYDLAVNIPPGTTKTALVSIFFPVWCWANWYWMRFITSSHNKDLSLESAEYSRDIVRSEKFKQLFPEVGIKQDKDVKSNFRIVLIDQRYVGFKPREKQGGGRVSTSVGAKITGFHAHIIISDDLIDPKASLSEVSLPAVNDYYDKTLFTRKTDKNVSTMILIMQRLHQDDPTGHLLQKKGLKLKHICLPGEIRMYGEFVKPAILKEKYIDDLLDPKRMPWDVLKELESVLGQYGYAGQIGQNPTPPGGGMFKVDHLSILDHMSSETNIVQRLRYWDKAGTQDGGCFTAGVLIWKMTNDKFIIADVKRGQWGTDVREDIIKSTAQADGRETEVYIEQEPGSGGKESAEATIKNLAGFACYRDLPQGDKARRADPFSVQVNWGNVILLRGEWNKAFKDELESFPNGKYKDQVDAGSAGFNLMTAQRVARVLNKRR